MFFSILAGRLGKTKYCFYQKGTGALNLSKLSMFSEVRCNYLESFDDFEELVKPDEWNLAKTGDQKDEFMVKPKNPKPLENWEIKLFRSKKFLFSMDSCVSYEKFVEVLENALKRLAEYLTPADITVMGVHGYYLYPVSSLQEFSQLVFAWSDNYLHDEATQVEISDLGVDVSFQKDSLKIDIVCKLVAKAEAAKYFPETETQRLAETNLFINIQISSDQPLKLQKTISVALSQTIKTHVYQATKIIEQRLDKLHAQS